MSRKGEVSMPSNKGKFQPVGVGMSPTTTELGSFVRACRLKLGMRQVPLSLQCGFARQMISQIETGMHKGLKNEQLEALANALQCDPEELRKRVPQRAIQPTTELGKLI